MNMKNKRLLSILLSFTIGASISGCARQSILSNSADDASIVSEYESSSNANDNETKKEVTTQTTTSVTTTTQATTTTKVSESTTKEKETAEVTTSKVTEEKEKSFYEDEGNICVTSNVNLREKPNTKSKVITVINKFEKLKRIKTNDSWDYVYYGDKKGYVSKKYTKELGDTFVEVDISKQNLYLYVDDELYLTADVVTGKKNKYDTRLGCNPIYAKQTDRYLNGADYRVYVNYWLPFDKGQGLHDASLRKSFDDDDYLNGSHGCVNMKYADAKTVYENVSVGTKVLVHK